MNTIIICLTVLACVYRITAKGLAFHVTHKHSSEDKFTGVPEDIPGKGSSVSLDNVLSEIYDTFGINIHTEGDED